MYVRVQLCKRDSACVRVYVCTTVFASGSNKVGGFRVSGLFLHLHIMQKKLEIQPMQKGFA